MEQLEYIKLYWNYIDDETPIVIFYEIALENERYATRMIEVFSNKKAVPVEENGFEFITETSVPTVDDINKEDEFFAEIISREEFEEAYHCSVYSGNVRFPKEVPNM